MLIFTLKLKVTLLFVHMVKKKGLKANSAGLCSMTDAVFQSTLSLINGQLF